MDSFENRSKLLMRQKNLLKEQLRAVEREIENLYAQRAQELEEKGWPRVYLSWVDDRQPHFFVVTTDEEFLDALRAIIAKAYDSFVELDHSQDNPGGFVTSYSVLVDWNKNQYDNCVAELPVPKDIQFCAEYPEGYFWD